MLQILSSWLERTSASQFIQNVLWIIPTIQTLHILAIAAVIGSVGMVTLRLFGAADRDAPISFSTRRFVPWIWSALVILAITGTILIVGEPARSLMNPAFQLKMLLLLVAIAITVAFQVTFQSHTKGLAETMEVGVIFKVFAAATFATWLTIAVLGRWIAYIDV